MKTDIKIKMGPQGLIQLNKFEADDSSETVFAELHVQEKGFPATNTHEIVAIKFGYVMGINNSRTWDSVHRAGDKFFLRIIPRVLLQEI